MIVRILNAGPEVGMTKRYVTTVCSIIVMIFVAVPVSARNPRVQVTVHGPSGWDMRVTSLLNKELRALGDVDISNDVPDYRIDLIVIEQTLETGGATGTLTVGVNFLIPLTTLDDTLSAGRCLPDTEKARLKQLRSANLHAQALAFSIPAAQLPRVAAEIVAAFDVTCLQPLRSRRESAG